MLRDHNLPLVAIRDTDEHLRRRRAWNRGLGPAALRAYEGVLAHRARLLVSKLEERAREGEEVDLGRWFGSFGYDFMSDMACVFPGFLGPRVERAFEAWLIGGRPLILLL